MTAAAAATPRFLRRTALRPDEYRKNFRQIDGDVIAAVTSEEADRVTPLMSKIYLRLVHAPAEYWERDGVLRFVGELREDEHVTAWEALCDVVGVASATARKALQWMHGQGIIGYFAGKNGVGIRVFLNRAASSIGTRAGQKILEFRRASSESARTSPGEAAFKDSFADLEVLDTECNPRAPESGAEQTTTVKAKSDEEPEIGSFEFRFQLLVAQLCRKFNHSVNDYTNQAITREHERTREWLENKGLPKVARVAQREAYNVLRKHGVINEGAGNSSAHAGVGRNECSLGAPHRLLHEEIEELAQACMAMLEVKGQSVEVTLWEMSAAAGGFLLEEDVPRVRERVSALLCGAARVEHEEPRRN